MRYAFVVAVAFAVAAAGYGNCRAQPKSGSEISLGPTTRVNVAGKGEDISEIWAAADPNDGAHLITCGMNSFPQQNISDGFVYSSADDGSTWRRTELEHATKFISEESCTYAGGSRAYFAAGESDTSAGLPRHEWGHLRLFASDDHGMTWRPVWKRKDGWVDWTYLAAVPATKTSPPTLVVFGNLATDRLGHWWEDGPVALESSDGGVSFSKPVASPVDYAESFAGGSVVLPDGTALFMSDAEGRAKAEYYDYAKHHYYAALFAYSPTTNLLQPRAIVRDSYGRTVSTAPALVRDSSNGPFRGRLYAAWMESGRFDSWLWLGTSDDGGHRWTSRPVLFGTSWRTPPTACQLRTPSQIKLAIDRTGTLGVLWDLNSRQLFVSFSHDGGRHFSRATLVASHGQTPFAIEDSVPFDEYFMQEVLLVNAGTWNDDVADFSHLGLSIRMGQFEAYSDYALVADARDTFHAIWGDSDPDGNHGLLTRTITVTGDQIGVSNLLEASTTLCRQPSIALKQPTPSATPRFEVAGLQDVSKSIVLQVRSTHFDLATKTVIADITFTNVSKPTLSHALSYVAVGLHSDYGNPVPLNATGLIQGQPFWDLSRVIPERGLAAHSTSQPLRLQFKLTDFRTLPGGYATFGGDAVAMRAFVYQKSGP